MPKNPTGVKERLWVAFPHKKGKFTFTWEIIFIHRDFPEELPAAEVLVGTWNEIQGIFPYRELAGNQSR